MSVIKTLMALSLVAIIAGCAQQEEVIMVDEPVMEEPTMSKY